MKFVDDELFDEILEECFNAETFSDVVLTFKGKMPDDSVVMMDLDLVVNMFDNLVDLESKHGMFHIEHSFNDHGLNASFVSTYDETYFIVATNSKNHFMAVMNFLKADETQDDQLRVYPKSSGLPMTIWICNNFVMVSGMVGKQEHPANTFSIICHTRSENEVYGEVADSNVGMIKDWINLNYDHLSSFWTGETDTVELCRSLKPYIAAINHTIH